MAFSTAKLAFTGPLGSIEKYAGAAANAALVNTLSRPLSAAGVTIATTATKVKTANTLVFTINGVFYSMNATDNLWTLSGTVVAASSWQKYALLVDTTGASGPSIVEGTQSKVSAAAVTWVNLGYNTPWDPYLSAVGSTKVVVGVLTVAIGSSGSFTPGTTALDDANVTDTYIDGVDQSLLPVIANAVGTTVGED